MSITALKKLVESSKATVLVAVIAVLGHAVHEAIKAGDVK